MKKITSILIMVFFYSVFFSGCSGKTALQQEEQQARRMQSLTGIVVMPVGVANEIADRDKVAGFVDGVVASELGKNGKVHLVKNEQLDVLLSDMAGGRLGQMKTLGARMGSNAVLEITVTRFQQREGGELSVNSPASAAFEMVLTHVDTGMILWAASFDETQESLTGNLLALGKIQSRGMKWITVEELVRQGVKERLAECPYLQK